MKVADETSGKYYRTELLVTLDDGRTVSVELSSSDPEPSYIEKHAAESYGEPYGDYSDYFCDGHYEREATRIIADKIIKGLSQ